MSLTLRTVSEFFTSALISSQKQINHIDKEANYVGGNIGTHVSLLCESIEANIDIGTCYNLEQFLTRLTLIGVETLQRQSSPILLCIHQFLQTLEECYEKKVESNALQTNNFHEQTRRFINALNTTIPKLEKFDILAECENSSDPNIMALCDKNVVNKEYRQYILDLKSSFINGLVVISGTWYGEDSLDLDVLDIIPTMVEKMEAIAANKHVKNENAPNHAVNQVFATFLRSMLEGMKVARSYDCATKAISNNNDEVIEIID